MQALASAVRLIKEGGASAVKLEGGRVRCEAVRKLVDSGVAVVGHVGLTPQAIGVLGGFRPQVPPLLPILLTLFRRLVRPRAQLSYSPKLRPTAIVYLFWSLFGMGWVFFGPLYDMI